MPHVIIELQSGRSTARKTKIADQVTEALVASVNCAAEPVSVGIEDVEQENWAEAVSKPDIVGKPNAIYKQPGYDPPE